MLHGDLIHWILDKRSALGGYIGKHIWGNDNKCENYPWRDN